jgi:hypothetical protein
VSKTATSANSRTIDRTSSSDNGAGASIIQNQFLDFGNRDAVPTVEGFLQISKDHPPNHLSRMERTIILDHRPKDQRPTLLKGTGNQTNLFEPRCIAEKPVN